MDMEIIAGVLVGLFAVATLAAIAIGVLGTFAGLDFMRCAQCGHLALTLRDHRPQECGYCRHPHLTHLGLDLRHSRAPHTNRL